MASHRPAEHLDWKRQLDGASRSDSHVDHLWTLHDLGAYLRLSEPGVRGMLKRREIPKDCILKLGKRRLRFIPDRVRAWLDIIDRATDQKKSEQLP